MDFELKKIKVYDKLSEETISFSAEIWENGKLITNVSNSGKGGSNDFSPYTPQYDNMDIEFEIFNKVEEYGFVTKLQSKNFVLKRNDDLFSVKFHSKLTLTKLKKHKDYSKWLDDKLINFKNKGYEVINRNL